MGQRFFEQPVNFDNRAAESTVELTIEQANRFLAEAKAYLEALRKQVAESEKKLDKYGGKDALLFEAAELRRMARWTKETEEDFRRGAIEKIYQRKI